MHIYKLQPVFSYNLRKGFFFKISNALCTLLITHEDLSELPAGKTREKVNFTTYTFYILLIVFFIIIPPIHYT